jgi:hypothetical protein
MIRSWLLVLPPLWSLVLAFLLFTGMQGFYLRTEARYHLPYYSLEYEGTRLSLILPCFAAMLYVGYRMRATHPAFRFEYYEWLCRTPWTSRKPLPLGPIYLVWQDALILALAVAWHWPRLQMQSLIVVQWFLGCYLIALGVMHYLTGRKVWAYVIGFGVGVMALSSLNLPVFAAAAAVTYALVWLGLRDSLAGYPWENCKNLLGMLGVSRNAVAAPETLGWPYERLSPKSADVIPFSKLDTLLQGLLAGWWFYVGNLALYSFARKGEDARILTDFLCVPFLVFGALARLAIYCFSYLPPISLFGRLVLGRWIIPGYDRVFIPSLMAFPIAAAAWWLPSWTSSDPLIVSSIAVTVAWWIYFGMGPSLKTWRLTGKHRIMDGTLVLKEMVRAG